MRLPGLQFAFSPPGILQGRELLEISESPRAALPGGWSLPPVMLGQTAFGVGARADVEPLSGDALKDVEKGLSKEYHGQLLEPQTSPTSRGAATN